MSDDIDFLVTWQIDTSAASAVQAAQDICADYFQAGNPATVFTVTNHVTGEAVEVDLGYEPPHVTVKPPVERKRGDLS